MTGEDVPRILAGAPTDEEAAALAAVFAQLVAERAAEALHAEERPRPSQWQRRQRALRAPLTGRWTEGLAFQG